MSGGGKTTTSTNSVPEWVNKAGQDVYGKALDFYNSGYTAPPTDRVAAFNPTEQAAFGSIGKFANGTFDVSPWMDKSIDAQLAPAIRNINEQSAAQRKQIGDQAIAANAFGDARQGILESRLNRNTNEAIGTTTADAYKGAYDTAYANAMNAVMAQLGIGSTQQQNEQSKLDATYQDWQTAQQDRYDRLAALVSSLGGVPFTRTQTTKESGDNSGLFGALGSLAGGLLKL